MYFNLFNKWLTFEEQVLLQYPLPSKKATLQLLASDQGTVNLLLQVHLKILFDKIQIGMMFICFLPCSSWIFEFSEIDSLFQE